MSVLVKERDYDDIESIRTSRTNPRVVRTVRRYRYPSDDYDNVNEEVDRIIVRDRERRHSPEETDDHIEIHRYDRSRDRDWDRESLHSGRSHHTHRTHPSHHPDDVDQVRIIERTRESSGPAPDTRREINITTERAARSRRSRSSSSSSSSSSGPSTHTTRTVRVEKDMEIVERAPSPVSVPYSVERYTKSAEYISRPERGHHHHHHQPMPIIIRSDAAPAPQPIIIRENSSPREIIIRQEIVQPQQQLVRREREEDRQVTRRESRDDDYYYERHVRREHPGRRHGDQLYEKDEIRRHRHDKESWSDDEVEYRRHRRVRSYSRSPSHSPTRHRRHLLEGAIGGVVAGEVIRHNRKKSGEEPGSRIANVAGYGALGAVGAEAVSRIKRWDDERRDHSRSRSGSRHRHRSRSRARSRSRTWGPLRGRSLSRGETLLAGAAGLAAIGAGLAYASNQNKKTKVVEKTTVIENNDRRSRSRHRRHSSTHVDEIESTDTRHMDPKHRNQRMAQAGVVGAALGALARSRSRSRNGSSRTRSQSKIREGVPIIAAGLGTAAATGLYERHKASQEAKKMRSRSVSRTRSAGTSRRHHEDLVEYGDGEIYSDDRDDRHRRHSRSRSRGRQHSSSPDVRHRHSSRSRSHSRSRNLGTAALAAGAVGAAGLAAHEASKRREERRAERERRRAEAATQGNLPVPSVGSYTDTTSTTSNYYPQTHQFPPPPGAPIGPPSPGYGDPSYAQQAYTPQPIPRYNPADYGPTSGPTMPPEDHHYQSQTEQYPAPPQAARDVHDRSRSQSRQRDDYRQRPEDVSATTTRSAQPGTSFPDVQG